MSDNDILIENLITNKQVSENFRIIPDNELTTFIDECNSISEKLGDNINDDDDIEYPSNINSSYCTYHDFNNIKVDPLSTFGIVHTNLASINKHFCDLDTSLSLLNVAFDVIGITEHKIQENGPTTNIDISGYHPFVFNPITTSHGGAGLYIKESLVYVERKDLQFNSTGNHESVFIELIIPNKKNMIIGCIYRHPSSSISIEQFSSEIIDSMLDKITSENKTCILLGDLNIDLLKSDDREDINMFYNNLSSNFFTPYILQPTRPASKTLIDNILINTIEYNSFSGNITISISDHLIQYVLLEGFYKELVPRKLNLYERNFKNFNEREFGESLKNMDWETILSLNNNDPNLSIEQLYKSINYLLDESAPYKQNSKKEYKLKSKPWINTKILSKIYERDKLLHKVCKEKESIKRENLHNQYKVLRNSITKMKRDSKVKYYKNYFEHNKAKSSSIWRGIRSLVKISSKSRKDIKIIDEKGNYISDPLKIANLYNSYFVNIGPSIDNKIPTSKINYTYYLNNIKLDKSFFLSPTTTEEIYELILSFDMHNP